MPKIPPIGEPDYFEIIKQHQTAIQELEGLVNPDLNEFAVLRVRKSTMPPGASLVVCYEVGGVPRIDDDLYPEFVVVRREDLMCLGIASGWDCDTQTYNRLKAAFTED